MWIYLFAGAVAGILAGLLGIGGGLVIVPILVFCFSWKGFDPTIIMHLALGTSMASIIFTSVSSFRSHHRRGAVRWDVVRRLVIGIFVGTLMGSCVASNLSTNFLKGIFVIFLYYVALQMLNGKKPQASSPLPGAAGMFCVGSIIGSVSSFVGIGGGSLSVPYLIWCDIPVHHAIGTSAAIGFPVAIAGTIGYITNGLSTTRLDQGMIGYIYLPALAGVVLASVITAPIGVWLAHSLPVNRLQKIFALLFLLMGTRMFWGVIKTQGWI